jgi:tryptophan synthase beta chain
VSQAIVEGLMRPAAVDQLHSYEAAITWARTEGFVIAPESSNAVAQVIKEANKAKKEGREKTILFNLSGHGLLDLMGYDKYLSGKLESSQVTKDEIKRSLDRVQKVHQASMRKTGKW